MLRVLFITALCLISTSAFGAATRHQCVAGNANIGPLQSLSVTAPNSANCAGASYGAQSYSASYTVGGCRGCGFLIEVYYGGSASGKTINGDRAYARYTLQDGVFLGSQIYNDLVDTNNSCNVPMGPTFGIGHSIHLMHGEDTVDLIYETDGTWNQGLGAAMTSAAVIGVYDDHGDITFDLERLPPDGNSRAHARVSNPLAFPSGVLSWSIRGDGEEGTLGCTINSTTGEIRAGEVEGKIIVRASATDFRAVSSSGN